MTIPANASPTDDVESSSQSNKAYFDSTAANAATSSTTPLNAKDGLEEPLATVVLVEEGNAAGHCRIAGCGVNDDDIDMGRLTCASFKRGFRSYKSRNAMYAVYGVNAFGAVLACNAMLALLAVNSFGSFLSVNSILSFASVNSVLSVGCANSLMKVCL